MSFSDLVKAERKRLGLTQEQLGAAVGVTQATVSNWEGQQTTPNPAEAARLAHALGRDPIELIGQLWPAVAELERVVEQVVGERAPSRSTKRARR